MLKINKTGKVNKVTFGDPNMKIRKNNPKARKSYLARSGGIKTKGQKNSISKLLVKKSLEINGS